MANQSYQSKNPYQLVYKKGQNRNEIGRDDNVNHGFRAFIFKTPEMLEYDLQEDDPIDPRKWLKKAVVACNVIGKISGLSIRKVISEEFKINIEEVYINRYVVYYNKLDNFFSIIYGFKFTRDDHLSKIGELRYILGLGFFSGGSISILN